MPSWLLSSRGPQPAVRDDHAESLWNTKTPRLLPRGQVPLVWSEVLALLILVMPQAGLSCSRVQNQTALWEAGARQNTCGTLTRLINCGLREAAIPSVLLTAVSLVHQWAAQHTVVVCVLSHVQLFMTPRTIARQAPLSVEFSRQEYWSGLPFPTPGDLPNPGIEPTSPALAGSFFSTELCGKLLADCSCSRNIF